MRSMIPIMKPDYSLDDLRLFWLVARSGSYKKASQESGVPLSTLSRRISVLEDALTVRLLERNPLRAMDALHLACAAEWGADVFATSDTRQFNAAVSEGLYAVQI